MLSENYFRVAMIYNLLSLISNSKTIKFPVLKESVWISLNNSIRFRLGLYINSSICASYWERPSPGVNCNGVMQLCILVHAFIEVSPYLSAQHTFMISTPFLPYCKYVDTFTGKLQLICLLLVKLFHLL